MNPNIGTANWLALKVADSSHYANHTWRPWRMLFNQNVEYVGVRFSSFFTEANYDKFWVSGTSSTAYHGNALLGDPYAPPLNQYLGPWFANGGGTAPAHIGFEWNTDDSVNFVGFNLDSLKVSCRQTYQSPVNTFELERNYPYEGLFLGSNDLMYVKVKQPAGYKMGLVLWPIDDADFDIFASNNNISSQLAEQAMERNA